MACGFYSTFFFPIQAAVAATIICSGRRQVSVHAVRRATVRSDRSFGQLVALVHDDACCFAFFFLFCRRFDQFLKCSYRFHVDCHRKIAGTFVLFSRPGSLSKRTLPIRSSNTDRQSCMLNLKRGTCDQL